MRREDYVAKQSVEILVESRPHQSNTKIYLVKKNVKGGSVFSEEEVTVEISKKIKEEVGERQFKNLRIVLGCQDWLNDRDAIYFAERNPDRVVRIPTKFDK